MQCALCKAQYVGKAKTAFNLRLNNHRKYVSNTKSIPADLHFKKPRHSFKLQAKFTLIGQLINIYKTNKGNLKWRLKSLKRCEDFWIKNLKR